MTVKLFTKGEDLLNLAYNSLRKIVAYGLFQQMVIFKEAGKALVTVNLSRKEMAQTMGIATESLNRTLSDFKEEKMISIEDGQVVIIDDNKIRNSSN